jgi:hypothetical protein
MFQNQSTQQIDSSIPLLTTSRSHSVPRPAPINPNMLYRPNNQSKKNLLIDESGAY